MKKKKIRNRFFFIFVLLLLYFFLFSIPIGKEIVFNPIWAKNIDTISQSELPFVADEYSSEENLVSFKLGERFGYVSETGGIKLLDTILSGITISDKYYIPS